MQIQDKVSIIVPIYNVEKYLNRCVESLIQQTYQNIQIILIDDGSSDKSGKICDYYKKKDSRIEVMHIKNSGVSNARNIALSQVTGQFITFVDADDYVDKNYIKELYELCKTNNSDISIIGVLENFEETNKKIISGKSIKSTLNNLDALKELLNEKYYFGSVWGKIYRTVIWKNICFNEKTVIGEDLEVLYKVFLKVNQVSINTDKRLYFYTKNRSDSVTKNNFNKNWEKEIKICEDILIDCNKKHDKVFHYALKRYVRINYSCIVNILKNTPEDMLNYKKLKENILKYKKYGIYNNFDLKMKIKLTLVLYFRKLAIKILKGNTK